MANVALYARISTRDKGQDSEVQLLQMRSWASANGHAVVAEYVDNVSGSGKVKRPQFERMMTEAASPSQSWSMLLFWSLDRLSREGVYKTLQHLQRLDEAGVCWRSHTEAYLDSCGVFKDAVLAILAVVAKQERLRISERVKAGLDKAASEGRKGGRRVVVHDPLVVARARELRSQGRSISQVAFEIGLKRTKTDRILRSVA